MLFGYTQAALPDAARTRMGQSDRCPAANSPG